MFKTLTGTTSLLGECPVWCERIERLFWTDMNDRFWPFAALNHRQLWVVSSHP
jgi:sugar lactone lactonase YvrE